MVTPRKVGLVAAILVGSFLLGLLIVRVYTGGGTVHPTFTDDEVRALAEDPAARSAYDEAVAAIGDEYEFTSSIFQDGDVIIDVEGLAAGDLAERYVRTAAGERQVVTGPDVQFERVPGADWEPVEPESVVLPLDTLRRAHVVRFDEDEDGQFEVFFLSGALGDDTSATRAEVVVDAEGTIQFVYGSGQGSFRIEVVTFVAPSPGVRIVVPG